MTVSFPDYIKNVASSEIYPTWPEELFKGGQVVVRVLHHQGVVGEGDGSAGGRITAEDILSFFMI